MADKIVTQDPTNPNIFKVNGPTLGPGGKILLSDLDAAGAINGQGIVLAGGVWTTGSPSSSDTASNLGAGSGVFASKVGADFQFKSLIAGTSITITPTGTDLTIDASGGGLTGDFTSSLQVLTPGGALTIAHGLASTPILIQVELVNQIANAGYSPGDILFINQGEATSGGGVGVSVVPDATDLNIRFGAAAWVFDVLNKLTGAGESIIAANWQIRFRVWA